jgi:hypothetical protein
LTSDKVDEEDEKICALRKKYWIEHVRPLVADANFIASLEKTTVRVKEPRVTTAHRDEAITVLKESVVYWDTHFQ